MRTITKPTVTRPNRHLYVDRSDAEAAGVTTFKPVPEQLVKFLVAVDPEDLWLEVPIRDGEWLAAYRIVASPSGAPVIAEMRLFPNEANRSHAGEWSGVLGASGAKVPPGGITARLFRELRASHYLGAMGQIFENIRRQGFETILHEHGITQTDPPSATGRRRGRRPFPDRFYAEVAQAYVKAYERGSANPARDAAKILSPARRRRVRDILHEARQRKLLTDVETGHRHGGQLTDRARALLENVPANVPATVLIPPKTTHRQPTAKRKTPR